MNHKEKEFIAVIRTQINNIVSPFLRNLTNQYSRFTPAEIKIANLIKDGKSTKEISELLNISVQSIEFHRKNIREKLGLVTKKVNLRSYLLSLT
jgi:DNA-binding CsgD family transcriptional regulator